MAHNGVQVHFYFHRASHVFRPIQVVNSRKRGVFTVFLKERKSRQSAAVHDLGSAAGGFCSCRIALSTCEQAIRPDYQKITTVYIRIARKSAIKGDLQVHWQKQCFYLHVHIFYNMTLPIQIAAIGAGVLFALFLLFKDRNATRARPLTCGGGGSRDSGENTYTYMPPTFDTHPVHNRRNTGNKMECVICLSVIEEEPPSRKLRCGHEFHVDCIRDWLRESRECPICRRYA